MGAMKNLSIKLIHGERLTDAEKTFLKASGYKAMIGNKNPEIQLDLFDCPQATETPETQEEMQKESNEKWLASMEEDAEWLAKEEMIRNGHLQPGDL